MIFDDNRFDYQIIWKEYNSGSASIHEFIHEELYMNKIVCRWTSANLRKHHKTKRDRISREVIQLLTGGSTTLFLLS